MSATPTRARRQSAAPAGTGGNKRRRRIAAAAALALAALLFPILDRFTHHTGETIVLLMVPALGAWLWLATPAPRRPAWWQYIAYAGFLAGCVAAAEYYLADMAGGRVLWTEVFWAFYFVLAWRLAWGAWTQTVGRAGERYRRWGRRARRAVGGWRWIGTPRQHRLAAGAMLIGPARVALAIVIFIPLAFGSLVHRFRIGNPAGPISRTGLRLQEVRFTTDDGLTLSGWFLPEPGSDATVIICHGAGANRNNFVDYLRVFQGQGYNSLIFDFRGHGDSDGHTCTFGLYETADVKAAVDWLQRERPEQARRIYGLGSSMGAMALVRQAAVDARIEAVILDSCFASAPLMARQHLGRIPVLGPLLAWPILASFSLHAGWSFWDLDARDAIASIGPRPVLLIHGRDDVMIPPVHMEVLYECTREPKAGWLGPGPHSNIMTTDFSEYRRRVIEFLQSATPQ